MLPDLLTLAIINIGIIIVKATVAAGFLAVFDKVIWPDVDFSEEIRKGNVAAGLFAGLVVLAIVLGSSLGR